MLSWFKKDNKSQDETTVQQKEESNFDQPHKPELQVTSSKNLIESATPSAIEKPKNSSNKSSWFSWPSKTPSSSSHSLEKDNESDRNTSFDKEILNDEGQAKLSELSPSVKELDFVPNPIVVDIFKDFPPYYREKAIERFSKREGFLRIDPVWYYHMEEERYAGKRGNFMDDTRFEEAPKEDAKRKKIADFAIENKKRREAEGEASQFENSISRTFGIPLQDEDSALEKLAELTGFFGCGIGFLYSGFTYERRNHHLKPKWMVIGRGIVGVGAFLFLSGFVTYYRFTDTGYFDRSVTKGKVFDQITQDLSTGIADKVLDLLGNEKGTNNKSK